MSAMEDYFWEAESEDLNLISRTFMSKVKTEYKMASYVERSRPQKRHYLTFVLSSTVIL